MGIWRGAGRMRITVVERVAERARVDLRVVAGDRAVALEPLHALGDGRRREADAAAELGEAEPAVLLELFEDSTVSDVVLPMIVQASAPR